MDPLITIITPFYFSEKYIKDAIESVLQQTYKNWELLLINDGSKDRSKAIAISYSDPRIRYFEQENKGVSAARNVGLASMKGEYFCFLDADDVLPFNSLASRLAVFQSNPITQFVDGIVLKKDSRLTVINQFWQPTFSGNPLNDLICLTGKSFLGLTWLVKRKPNRHYQLKEGLTHGEDLFFYMELARQGGLYAYTDEPILHYRDSPGSAMKNLIGLENGYRFIESQIKNWPEVSKRDLSTFRFRYKKAMFLAYLRNGNWERATKCWF